MSAELELLGEKVAAALPGAVRGLKIAYGELTVEVERARWLDVARVLRDDPEFLFVSFIDITAADYPGARSALRRGAASVCRPSTTAHPREDADRRGDARSPR